MEFGYNKYSSYKDNDRGAAKIFITNMHVMTMYLQKEREVL